MPKPARFLASQKTSVFLGYTNRGIDYNNFFIPSFINIFMSLNITEKKPRVIDILKEQGPSLPSQISGKISLSLLFTSALLSEMVSDKTVRISYLKVGGSPLYLLPGQENMLENFIKNLHGKEKEALALLKEKEILSDEDLEPVQRVCLNSIKDFALQLKINLNNQQKVFWRYFTVPEDEAIKKAEEHISNVPKVSLPRESKEPDKKLEEFEKPDEIQETIKRLKEEKAIKPLHPIGLDEREAFEAKEKEKETKIEVKVEEQKILHPEILKKKVKKRAPTKKKKDFISKALDHIHEKEMVVVRNFEDESKVCVAQMDSKLGLMNFLVYSINKKSLTEADLSLAYTEGQNERLPVLLVTNGKLTKKAEEYQKKLGNFLIVNKI